MAKPLFRAEQEKMVQSIRLLLKDPDAHLTRDARLRWEGALTALEVVLGETPTLGLGSVDPGSL